MVFRKDTRAKSLDSNYDVHHKTASQFGRSDIVQAFARPNQAPRSLSKLLFAMALSRCWKIVLALTVFAAVISVLNDHGRKLSFQPTLLTVLGTVLGFVISYRTLSSFERYNEGRKYWSQIIQASRNLAVTVWLMSDTQESIKGDELRTEGERKARVIVEKKTMVNLIEAFSVAVKHNLRGEEGTIYEDLHHLVKFLPPYAIQKEDPEGSSLEEPISVNSTDDSLIQCGMDEKEGNAVAGSAEPRRCESPDQMNASFDTILPAPASMSKRRPSLFRSASLVTFKVQPLETTEGHGTSSVGQAPLFPANNPPERSAWDILPFWGFIEDVRQERKHEKEKRSRDPHCHASAVMSKNIPLVILWYMNSYVSALSDRKWIDASRAGIMNGGINQLTDALTGLERIRTTPLPFSYLTHLWIITIIYCMALPFQLWPQIRWLTIPATTVTSYILVGFLEAGDEIENPFGYDKNDLNLGFFTRDIIRNELLALTARPPPNPSDWMFLDSNDHIFSIHRSDCDSGATHRSPEQWVALGEDQMWKALRWY